MVETINITPQDKIIKRQLEDNVWFICEIIEFFGEIVLYTNNKYKKYTLEYLSIIREPESGSQLPPIITYDKQYQSLYRGDTYKIIYKNNHILNIKVFDEW